LKIQLVYSEIDDRKISKTAEAITTNFDIAQDLKERLLEAVIHLNVEDINQTINEINISNPQAGFVLHKLSSELHFQEIWTIIKGESTHERDKSNQ